MQEYTTLIFTAILVILAAGCSACLILFERLYGFVLPSKLPETAVSKIDNFKKGRMLYHNNLSCEADVAGWVMEGPGKIDFVDNTLIMASPNGEFHHVFWCPQNFPGSFIAEWSVQNVNPEAGLLIVFFAAKGLKNEDLFDPSLKTRTGKFSDYTRSDIKNYHISYYANARNEPGRLNANLRKNKSFHFMQKGRAGIPIHSSDIHKITLVKNNNHILLFIDGREAINWTDSGKIGGDAHMDGKIGFRQMKWSRFSYHNFTVYEVSGT